MARIAVLIVAVLAAAGQSPVLAQMLDEPDLGIEYYWGARRDRDPVVRAVANRWLQQQADTCRSNGGAWIQLGAQHPTCQRLSPEGPAPDLGDRAAANAHWDDRDSNDDATKQLAIMWLDDAARACVETGGEVVSLKELAPVCRPPSASGDVSQGQTVNVGTPAGVPADLAPPDEGSGQAPTGRVSITCDANGRTEIGRSLLCRVRTPGVVAAVVDVDWEVEPTDRFGCPMDSTGPQHEREIRLVPRCRGNYRLVAMAWGEEDRSLGRARMQVTVIERRTDTGAVVRPWYQRPAFWIAAGGGAAASVFLVRANRTAHQHGG